MKWKWLWCWLSRICQLDSVQTCTKKNM